MSEPKRLLVLCVDVDDDLGVKAKVKGPLVGRQANIEAATKLMVADPQDTDGNTIFDAVKAFDGLKRDGYEVEVATITGSQRLGYYADREIVKQLEKVLASFMPEACVFVSDGASDDSILPLVQSRVKISSVRQVVVKQSKELEKTYFVLLEKLKEPHFARIVFGIPGMLLLLMFAFQDAGIRIFIGLFGGYLLLKGFGIEELVLSRIARSELSLERMTFIFYFAAVPLAIVSVYLGIARVATLQQEGVTNIAKIAAWVLKDFVLLFPIAVMLVLAGNLLEVINQNKRYAIPTYAIYFSAVALFWMIANNAADWVIGTISFSDFFLSLLFSIVAMYLVILLSRQFKSGIIARMKLEGKEVYTEIGGLIGKIAGIDKRKGTFLVKTGSGQKIDFDFERLSGIGD
ncbi:MAG: DUF373 family protein, partial [Candidatus Micrarchaeota archaeon]